MVVNLYLNIVPVREIPAMANIVQQHQSISIASIRTNLFLAISTTLCALIVLAEIVYCVKTNLTAIRGKLLFYKLLNVK
jgi:hypothetical protein